MGAHTATAPKEITLALRASHPYEGPLPFSLCSNGSCFCNPAKTLGSRTSLWRSSLIFALIQVPQIQQFADPRGFNILISGERFDQITQHGVDLFLSFVGDPGRVLHRCGSIFRDT